MLDFKNEKELQYYIYITKVQNLSYRNLHNRIKSKEYERIGKDLDIEKPKVNTLIKNPILIKSKKQKKRN